MNEVADCTGDTLRLSFRNAAIDEAPENRDNIRGILYCYKSILYKKENQWLPNNLKLNTVRENTLINF